MTALVCCAAGFAEVCDWGWRGCCGDGAVSLLGWELIFHLLIELHLSTLTLSEQPLSTSEGFSMAYQTIFFFHTGLRNWKQQLYCRVRILSEFCDLRTDSSQKQTPRENADEILIVPNLANEG